MKPPYYTIVTRGQKSHPIHFEGMFETEEEALKCFKGPCGAVETWLVKVIDYRDVVKEWRDGK